MWFNNLLIYHYTLDESSDLNHCLSEERLKPCPPHARFIYGWLPVFAEEMTQQVAGSALLCMVKKSVSSLVVLLIKY